MTEDVPPTGVLELAGTFTEVTRPCRLAYTWRWTNDFGSESHVLVEFLPEDERTSRLTIKHTGLRDQDDVNNHLQGWTDCLDRLELWLRRRPGSQINSV